MKKAISVFLLIAGAAVIMLNSSCKKKEDDNSTKTPASLDGSVQQHNNDANNYKDQSDQSDNDINAALDSTSINTGRLAGNYGNPMINSCIDWQIDSTLIAQKKVNFHFLGISCYGRTRTGDISVELTGGTKWADVGSVLTLTYTNFKVAFANGNWIQFSGTKTLKNLNGNNWLGFFTNTATLKYQERAYNISVDFNGGYHATWNSARTTEYSYTFATQNVTLTARGDTSYGAFTNVDSWGYNRYNRPFTTYYLSPLISTSACSWRPSSGQLVHNVNSTDFTLTLGTDASGNTTSSGCPNYFKVVWKDLSGNTDTVVLSYWY